MFSYKDQKQSQSPRGDGKQASVAQGLRVTEDEVDAMIDQFASSDEAFEKTWSRRVVEYFFMHVSTVFYVANIHRQMGRKEGSNERGQSRDEANTPRALYFPFRHALTL
jgi:hypothetical protein